MKTEKHITNSENETIELGKLFAGRLKTGDIVAFEGELGSGKTEFIKGICDFFQVDDIVTSPTFTIINQYMGYIGNNEVPIYHIDLYRIKTDKEYSEIGFEECISDPTGIKLIEWSEKANGIIPDAGYRINIALEDSDEDKRYFTITSV